MGYFKPQEGKSALWELDSDYYLHVSGIGDDSVSDKRSPSDDAMALGVNASLEPIPACREDFLRMKLTSFDKLIEKTCSLIKDVRLCREPGQEPIGTAGTSGVAPDAIEIQLKSPNWLFGQRKDEQDGSAQKAPTGANTNAASQVERRINSLDLSWLSSIEDSSEEDTFQSYFAMTSVNEANGWYGGSLLGDLDENSEIYKHYARLCEGPAMEPFENDMEREQHYADVVQQSMIENADGVAIQAEMEAALKEYDQVSSDLGIFPMCRSLAGDPSQLTRWIIGEEKIPRI